MEYTIFYLKGRTVVRAIRHRVIVDVLATLFPIDEEIFSVSALIKLVNSPI